VTIGVEPLYVTGKHEEPGYLISGGLFGAVGEFTARSGPVELTFEGIPGIQAHDSNHEHNAGFPSVAIMQFGLRGYVTPRVFVGLGEAVYNQATPFTTPREIEYTDSRVVGAMYTAGFKVPMHAHTFITGWVDVMPHLNGVISYRQTPHKNPVGEYASNVEPQISIGRHAGRWDYLAGLRGFNFAANFDNGNAADRNVAYGVFAEARYIFRR
jgi:hypothetical protein